MTSGSVAVLRWLSFVGEFILDTADYISFSSLFFLNKIMCFKQNMCQRPWLPLNLLEGSSLLKHHLYVLKMH